MSAALVSLPYKQFRRNPHFYLWYDGTWGVLIALAVLALLASDWPGLFPDWNPWLLLVIPVAAYSQVVAHLFVHNATHKSWPRAVNRLVGELCGAWVMTRFASWEIVHQRHHAYSEDRDKDPHPVIANFWKFAIKTIINVEKQLQNAYFDVYGNTPENQRYERLRALVSFAVGLWLFFAWYLVWGPAGFFAVYLPSVFLGGLHIIHFNWSTHNGFSPTRDFRPVNLDHGLYWVGNRIFFGIYYHANHHYRPGLFNPAYLRPSLPVEPPAGALVTETSARQEP